MDKPRGKGDDSQAGRAQKKKAKYLKPVLVTHGSILLAASKAWAAKPRLR